MLAKTLRLLPFIAAMLTLQPAHADIVAKPYTWSAGQTLPASQLNANFDAIYNNYNGNITNSNIKAAAQIDPAKFDLTKAYGPILRAATQSTFSAGTTGDGAPRWQVLGDGTMTWNSAGSGAFNTQLQILGARSLLLTGATATDNAALTLLSAIAKNQSDAGPRITLNGDGTSNPGLLFGSGSGGYNLRLYREDANTVGLDNLSAGYKNMHIGALNLETALPATEGGTGLTSPGTAGNVLTSNGTSWVSSTGYGFGGNGTDGALNVTGTTNVGGAPTQMNCTTINIANTGTLFNYEYCLMASARETITIDGGVTINIQKSNGGLGGFDQVGAGGGANGQRGGGLAGGEGGINGASGGGGGGSSVAAGGAGGNASAGQEPWSGGLPTGNFTLKSSGGGGGGTLSAPNIAHSGNGGSGAPSVWFMAIGAIDLQDEADLVCNTQGGEDGGAGSQGAGGGEGGTTWGLLSQTSVTIDIAAGIQAKGGDAGAAGTSGATGGGGGGGGGAVLIYAPTISNACTPNVTHGAGSAGNSTGDAGTDGEDGEVIEVPNATPNGPIISFFRDDNGLGQLLPMVRTAKAVGSRTPQGAVVLQHQFVCHQAAKGDFVKYCKLFTERQMPGAEATCLGVGDSVKVLGDRG